MISDRISDNVPPEMKIFIYGYPHFNAHLQFPLKLKHCKLNKAACQPMKCDVINYVKQFPTLYHRIYSPKFLTLSNRMLQKEVHLNAIITSKLPFVIKSVLFSQTFMKIDPL